MSRLITAFSLTAALLLAACANGPAAKDEAHPGPRAAPTTEVAARPLGDAPRAEPHPFESWVGIVVAADWRASTGNRTEAFDNARRDVSLAFINAGFKPQHIAQYSAQAPKDDPIKPPEPSVQRLKATMNSLLTMSGGGCLFYLTSHGDKRGIVLGEDVLSPKQFSDVIEGSCGLRPTVIMISACHSGVFMPALEAPNRLVMTAARPDRTSFGCGEADKYPYFDACMLESMASAVNFRSLTNGITGCVARREKAQGFLASEPQLKIGANFAPIADGVRFRGR